MDSIDIIIFQAQLYLKQFSVIDFYRLNGYEAFKKYVNDEINYRRTKNVANESTTANIEDKIV